MSPVTGCPRSLANARNLPSSMYSHQGGMSGGVMISAQRRRILLASRILRSRERCFARFITPPFRTAAALSLSAHILYTSDTATKPYGLARCLNSSSQATRQQIGATRGRFRPRKARLSGSMPCCIQRKWTRPRRRCGPQSSPTAALHRGVDADCYLYRLCRLIVVGVDVNSTRSSRWPPHHHVLRAIYSETRRS